jgi:arylsulfatase A-like enzyme
MKTNISRREFLKLSAITSTASLLPFLHLAPSRNTGDSLPNILILVYDALSAKHISMYGYERDTTPNLNRLANRATIFHQHYAGGNYTFPGTTSLLTGTYPWTHRGINQYRGIHPDFYNKNIFQLFDQYYRLSYSHNSLANNLFMNMQEYIDQIKPRVELMLTQSQATDFLFSNDEHVAWLSWWLAVEKLDRNYSLFLSNIIELIKGKLSSKYNQLFPRGLPSEEGQTYLLETASDWTISQISAIQQPFLAYLHYLPPHDPYNTRIEFIDTFLDDGFEPVRKGEHIFSRGFSHSRMDYYRRFYDEFILYADMEFARIFAELDQNGILDNTILVFTSDHGEIFERGLEKHFHETLHQPAIQIPLMIFMPGQTARRDVYSATSASDLLPTLLHLTGQPIPDWIEGQILPPFTDDPVDPDRSVYAVEAKDSPKYGPLNPVSLMIVKNGYKLTYYADWERQGANTPIIELYSIEDDPEELNNLADDMPDLREKLLEEVFAKESEASKKNTIS